MMKRFLIVFTLFCAVAALGSACNNYVCPAYSQDTHQADQVDDAEV